MTTSDRNGEAPRRADAAEAQTARENEERFAAANAGIVEKALSLRFGGEQVPFLCECSDVRCTQILLLPLDAYQAKAQAGAFLLVAGHDDASVERVVDQADGYVLVKKFR